MLNALDSTVPQRYWAWGACIIAAVFSLLASAWSGWWVLPALAFGALSFVGYMDYSQTR